MFSKNRNKIKNILIAIIPGLIVAGFWGFASSNPRTIFDESRLTDSIMVIDANDSQKRTIIAAELLETDEPEWVCGDNITFNYRREQVTYGTVENPTTSECWMDRNLGADQVATAYNDHQAYGDLFQWGRLDDDHQGITWTGPSSGTPDHTTTSTLSTTDVPGHNNFISADEDSKYDWRDGQNENLWQGDEGINDPCPLGWRIPTETEWNNERLFWSSNNYHGAIASPLKLPAGGYRYSIGGGLGNVGSGGYYWSSNVSDTESRVLINLSTNADMFSRYRANGVSVRCIQD